MENKYPKVSIIMGAYNCEETIGEALESIINQTYRNIEIIICNDCSSDNTLQVLKRYEEKYSDVIKVLSNDNNITLAPTLNKCLKYVTGKYIARQDGDDFSDLDRIRQQVEFLEENLEYDLVGTNMISFDSNGENGVHKLKNIPNKNDLIKYGVTFSHATIMMKREVMEELNGYSSAWYAVQAEDYELWSRFFENGYKGYNLDRNLYYVREDIETYKRKNIKRRLRGFVLRFKVHRRLKASIYTYLYIIKDIIALFIPRQVFIKYYKYRMSRANSGAN